MVLAILIAFSGKSNCAGRQKHTTMDHRAGGAMGHLNPTFCVCTETLSSSTNQQDLTTRRIGSAPLCICVDEKQVSIINMTIYARTTCDCIDFQLFSVNGHPMWLHGICGQRG